MGKQRIEIKKLESKEARQICFSRRKAGIFSDANEIATLCGAKVVVLIESPVGTPFSFGSPSVNHVAGRFLRGGVDDTEAEEYEAQWLLKSQELNNEMLEASSKFEEALRRKQILLRRIAELCEVNEDARSVENVENLNPDELRKMIESLDKFKKAVRAKIIKDIIAKPGHPIAANLKLSGNGTGPWNGHPTPTNLNLSGNGTAIPFTTNVKSNYEGPSRVEGHPIAANLNMSGNGTGHPIAANLNLSGNGTSQWNGHPIPANLNLSGNGTAIPFTTNVISNYEGPSRVEGLDVNLNLFESGSLGHFGQFYPFITPNATDVGPSKPQLVSPNKTVSGRGPVELDLLGDCANFVVGKEPK